MWRKLEPEEIAFNQRINAVYLSEELSFEEAVREYRRIEAEFVARAKAHFEDAVARFLTGDEAFTAKLVPEYAIYADYDQLMRRDEWYGRE